MTEFFVSMGLVPIGQQSQPAFDRTAIPITTRVYPRRMMIGWWRLESETTPIAKPLGVPPMLTRSAKNNSRAAQAAGLNRGKHRKIQLASTRMLAHLG